MHSRNIYSCILVLLLMGPPGIHASAQKSEPGYPDILWTSQSKNSGESMPCGGGDIGLNVWVEEGDILCYMAQSGAFDENNALLKGGRVRVKLSPNPFTGGTFSQELKLRKGCVVITGTNKEVSATVTVWVDVFHPVIHIAVKSSKPVTTTAGYESWRYKDRDLHGKENNANSWKWAPQGTVKTWQDSIAYRDNGVLFFHHNRDTTVFDAAVRQQGLDRLKDRLYNPLKHQVFGGRMEGSHMRQAGEYSGVYLGIPFRGWRLQSATPERSSEVAVYLYHAASQNWLSGLGKVVQDARQVGSKALQRTQSWWEQFLNRSFILINPDGKDTGDIAWQAGRNYGLFRYMLGCNAYGSSPTKFNGGLFTYDPVLTDTSLPFTPDFRNWGGGTHTAQNQRLVYYPMIRSGDFEGLLPQLDFYLRLLKNAELRTQAYWHHPGACFTEQLENFGLPNPAEYGWKRPAGFDPGVEYNAWLEYEWDTVLEYCLMMLDYERYTGKDISRYLPFIQSCLTFFDEHYRYLARARGRKELDGSGHLILYPGSGGETYKMAYNASSTIAGLKTVLTRLTELPERYGDAAQRMVWVAMLQRIPPVSFRTFGGHPTIAPAQAWERINNVEAMQLYPVFPWGIYGVGKPGLDTARNTWRYDTLVIKFRSHVGWKQDNIFAARLGLKDEAASLTMQKLKNSGRRFPAFWGPGFDWTPDHNWGGSGMIGLQEMLMQTDGRKIFLFPAWPSDLDVHFRLFAPYNTTVEATIKNGRLEQVLVIPEERRKDIINLLGTNVAAGASQ